MTDFVTALISYIGDIFNFLNILFGVFGIILRIIINPYLFLLTLFTIAHIYVFIASNTRKEIVMNYGRFFEKAIKGFYAIIQAAIPLMMSVVRAVAQIIQGLMDTPQITVLGTGVSLGTVVATIVAAIIIGSLLFK